MWGLHATTDPELAYALFDIIEVSGCSVARLLLKTLDSGVGAKTTGLKQCYSGPSARAA